MLDEKTRVLVQKPWKSISGSGNNHLWEIKKSDRDWELPIEFTRRVDFGELDKSIWDESLIKELWREYKMRDWRK